MTKDISKQEILLVTTAFSKKSFCQRNSPERNSSLSASEQLEEACWNGLLDDLLGDIIERSETGRRLSVWQIRQGEAFIEVELCDYPQALEKHLSINPYIFEPSMNYN